MKSDVKNIAENALNLSPSARAYLAEILLESLDFEEDFQTSRPKGERGARNHRRERGGPVPPDHPDRRLRLISGEAAGGREAELIPPRCTRPEGPVEVPLLPSPVRWSPVAPVPGPWRL